MATQAESGRQQLANLLRQVYQDSQSGHIFYIVRGGANGKIEVNQGDLYSLVYKGKSISILDLVSFDLNQSVLVERTANASLSPSPGVPNITELIHTLESYVSEPEKVPEPQASRETPAVDTAEPQVDLTSAAMQILTGLYGSDRAFKQVNKVAGRYPPDQHPQQFIEKCTELAELTLGPGAAHEMFTPLYEKVLNR